MIGHDTCYVTNSPMSKQSTSSDRFLALISTISSFMPECGDFIYGGKLRQLGGVWR